MARIAIIGAETGDLSELPSAGASTSADSSQNTGKGNYSFKTTANAGSSQMVNAVNKTRVRVKLNFRLSGVSPPTAPDNWVFLLASFYDSSVTQQCLVYLLQDSAGDFWWLVYDSATSPAVFQKLNANLAINTWYRFEIDFTKGAGTGAISLYKGGVQEASATSQQFGANNIDIVAAMGRGDASTPARNCWVDDYEIDDAALCGDSYVIARQIKAGTPTYDNWTKLGP